MVRSPLHPPRCASGRRRCIRLPRQVRDQIIKLTENNTSLIGLLFWLGFRRCEVPYARRACEHGASAWTLRKKMVYMMDSVFAFSDLPIRMLLLLGTAGLVLSIDRSIAVLGAKLTGAHPSTWLCCDGATLSSARSTAWV